MSKRSTGVYAGENGEVMVTFETGVKGVPIEELLPPSGRGEGFADFLVADYFALAEVVLANPADVARLGGDPRVKSATKAAPARISLPIDIDHLQLRTKGNALDADRTVELFEVVQAYWQAEQNSMALKPGLVAGLWRGGMDAATIIRCIRQFTGPDGQLLPMTGRGPDIMFTVIDVYRQLQDLPKDTVLPQADMERLVLGWIRATRSVAVDSKDASNEVLHWADYRRLGLVDDAGRANLDRTRRVAERVFTTEPAPDFADLVAWTDSLNPKPTVPPAAKAAQAKLKKKRKQARLNRKRGRR